MRTARSKATAGATAGLALALALAACSTGDTDPVGTGTPSDSGMHSGHGGEMPTDDANDLSAVMPEGTGDPFADVRTAAEHMPMTGETLAVGLATATGTEGDATSPAADLRGTLTALLQEHVYLAGIAVATAYHAGPDSAEFELAVAAVDGNSVDLAAEVGSLAGEDQGEAFLERWRDHIGYFVDYALAAAAEDQAGKDAAVDELREYTVEAGAFFEEISGGELPAAAVTESLNGHVDTLATAVDLLAAGDPGAFAALQMASHHVVEGAATLSVGLATAAGLEGDATDPAAELRTFLTANLNEHVYVAGIAVFVAYTQGADSEAFAAAAEVVDGNAVELADGVGSLAGDERREPFLQLWRDHIGYFVDYAVAVASADEESAQTALAELDQYRHDAGDFFEEVSAGELPADAIADGLGMHIRTLGGAIDSLNEALVQNS